MRDAVRSGWVWCSLVVALAGCDRGPAVEMGPSLPLRRVVVYRNGVGYFERQGRVEGSEVRFKVQQSEVGDFLATLAVMERGGSSVRAAAFPMPPEVSADAQVRPTTRRMVRLTLDGRGHDLTVGYTVETPIWRPSYRVVVDAHGKLQLQAWGIVQNLSGEDWTDVELSLVAGSPVSFRSELATAVVPVRPVVTDHGSVIDSVPQGETTLAQGPSSEAAQGPARSGGVFAQLGAADGQNANGSMTGDSTGDAFGFGGLGATGTGWGGGGAGEGTIGLGNLGTMGHGSGAGQGYGSGAGRGLSGRGSSGPIVRASPPTVSGLLSPEAVRRVVLRNLGQVNHCYEQGLASNPSLAGRVVVRFVIGGNGTVMASTVADSSLASPGVDACVSNAVRRWQFPAPEGGGIVSVNYPFTMSMPDEGGAPGGSQRPQPRPQPPPTSAPRNVASLAAIAEQGGATRYDLPARVTVPDHTATMVMLIAREIPGSLTYLFAPDPGVPDSSSHPFHVARFENRTGAMLERGPLAMFQSNAFLGEGLLEPLPDGASATVPFALIRAISIDSARTNATEGARLVRIQHEAITIERYDVTRTTYHIRNGTDRAVEVRVRHALSDGATLFEAPARTEQIDGAALVPFNVPARGHVDPVVVARRAFAESNDWTSDAAVTAIRDYLRDGHPEAAVATALQSALDMRHEMGTLQTERTGLDQQRSDQQQSADETRQNLDAIQHNARAADLRGQLTARLARVATELDRITRRVVEIDTSLGERRVRLAETVRAIELDTTAHPAPPAR